MEAEKPVLAFPAEIREDVRTMPSQNADKRAPLSADVPAAEI